MSDVIISSFDLWTSAVLDKSNAGRASNGHQEAYGIKKLRELILELAVRGRLVPQDPNDEPASELLKRTITVKERLISQGILRGAKPPMLPVELPTHELPTTWVWTTLHEIGEIAPRNEADASAEASFIPMQAISDDYGVQVQHEVRPWGEIRAAFTHFREGDVVLAKITPCFQNGKSAVMRGLTNGFGAGTTELHVFRSINSCTIPEYVLIYLKSPRFIGDGIPKMTGTAGQKRITRDYFAGHPFPLPPLSQQYLIVAKVDELMGLCDQLEKQQAHSMDVNEALIATLLGTLTRARSAREASEAWGRIGDYFDTLFTTERSVDQLKQTIIQLGVMGSLLPQDASDEPAAVLLTGIGAEKERLVEEGLISSQKLYPEIAAEERLFAIPQSWRWVRLDVLVNTIVDCPHSTPKFTDAGFLCLDTNSFKQGVLLESKFRYVDADTYAERIARLTPGEGDIVFAREGSVGESVVLPAGLQCCLGQRVMLLRLSKRLNSEFVRLSISAPRSREAMLELHKGIGAKHVNVGDMRHFVIALPPAAEQERIVAKIEELLAMCDALKARLADAQTNHIRLADAIVEQAVA